MVIRRADRLGPLLLLVIAFGCRTLPAPPINPRAPEEARSLAESAEPGPAADLWWLELNDAARARKQLDAGLAQTPGDPALLLRRAALSFEALQTEAAIDDLLAILGGPEGPEVEAALVLLGDRALPWPRLHPRVIEALRHFLAQPGPHGAARIAGAARLLAELEERTGNLGPSQGALDRGGWITRCRAVGPVAPPADVALFEPTRYERGDRPWAPADPFRGLVPPIRTIDHRAGALLYSAGERQGLYVLECYFEIAGGAPRSLILEAQLDGPGRVGIDGVPVLTRDLAKTRGRRIQRERLRLEPGWHRLTAAVLGGSEGRPAFSLLSAEGDRVIREATPALPEGQPRPREAPELGGDAEAADSVSILVDRLVTDELSQSWGRFLGATLYASRRVDDLERARDLIEPARHAETRSAGLLTAWARVQRSADLAEGEAGAVLREAALLAPDAAATLLELAKVELRDAPERALEALAKVTALAPRHPEGPVLIFRAYRQKGWNAEAAKALETAAALGAPPEVLLDGAVFLRNLERLEAAERLEAQAKSEDPAEAHAQRAFEALRRGDLDLAIRAHQEGAAAPDGLYHALKIAELELARGRAPEALTAAQRALERDPLASRAWRLALLAASSLGDVASVERAQQALSALGELDLPLWSLAAAALGRAPEASALPPTLAQRLIYDPWPEVRYLPGTTTPKGLDPTGRWSGHKAVQLLDRVVDVVHGSQTLSFRHSVLRLQTKEATDQAGELNLPPEAWPLSLRTLKPDGSTKEVDRHSGKDDLSFSALAPGDAVERRFVSLEGAATPWGGYLRQFYFRGTAPIERSELVVVVPKGAQVFTHSYHGAPEPERSETATETIYYFHAEQVAPLEPEPGAVDQDEYLPYVIIAVDLPSEVARLTNSLALERTLQASPRVAAAAAELTQGVDGEPGKIRALFDFVTRQVSLGDSREPAVVLASRRGTRSGLFTTLLRAVGIPAELGLARAGAAPLVVPPFPDAGRYDLEVVKIPLSDGGTLWALVDDKHPWLGKLPPELRHGEYTLFDGRRLGRGFEIAPSDVEPWPLTSAVDLAVDPNGTARGTITVQLPGAFGSEIREFLLTARQEDVQRQMQSWVGALVPGALLVRFSTEGRDEALTPLLLRAEVEIEQFLVADQGHWVAEQFFGAPLALQSLGLPTLASYVRLPRRETPLLFRELSEHMEVRVVLPEGAKTPIEAPEAFVRQAAYGRFAQQVSYDERRRELLLVVDHQIPLLRMDPAAIPAFLAGAQEILQSSRNRLVVPRGDAGPKGHP